MHVLVLQCQKTVLVLAHDISWSVDAEHIAEELEDVCSGWHPQGNSD